ncbi:LADA_0E09604g1_1 [Lachancea dasiensis]|uniref:Acetyltransferase component of pyruvate dehydrogenase complex n=1 Tax=Lachancea dasiensis TaxID=1072105 RepID=A0A1G4JDT8_9SACH|nr:LADA_0E09604g1_1 [Lachancea dasiensis]
MSAFIRTIPSVRASILRSARLQLRTYASYPPHTVIGMPALSPTMTQGSLAVWSKQVGDQLEPGCVLAEIETDKAQMEFEFQDDGYLAKLLVSEGTKDLPVGKPIAVYVEDEGDVAAFKDFEVEDSGASQSAAAPEAKKEEPKKEEASSEAAAPKKKASSAGSSSAPTDRIIASPLAKTIALDKGISLKEVTGSGPNGRITKSDVEAYLKKAPAAPAKAASPAATGSAAAAEYEDIPITSMRKIIGDRLLESTSGTPSYIVSSQVSVSKLLKLRQSLNASGKDQYKLSVNDMLIKAITVAAQKVPDANAYWMPSEGVIRKFKNVDVSVAVATPQGLLTPIVKNANHKGLVSISQEVKELGKRAKINKLKPEEFQGGTICISNLGMNNAVSMFTSIINPPQSTILAIATVQRVAVEDAGAEYGFSFDDKINITGTFDHRTIDGAKAGDFMKELKKIIENPLEMLL